MGVGWGVGKKWWVGVGVGEGVGVGVGWGVGKRWWVGVGVGEGVGVGRKGWEETRVMAINRKMRGFGDGIVDFFFFFFFKRTKRRERGE